MLQDDINLYKLGLEQKKLANATSKNLLRKQLDICKQQKGIVESLLKNKSISPQYKALLERNKITLSASSDAIQKKINSNQRAIPSIENLTTL